ncbi:AraC family transcriptional regulator [Amycolatopsis sp. WAC 01416]|uniref:AraC family transcriptional regulator n=1 Tax=Amycolatopsis sp. WAC 01416 TaxID=2203196 RepID=UPI000F7B88A2|nr:AraC family transcriptional regulator [Amycolatopsis sp. WAC 01416]RSN33311.1 AraC family transcriptional regulator [Amycolatopsis sp. WAC 01416]
MTPADAAIPPTLLSAVVAIGRQAGLPVSAWFSGTGLEPGLLEDVDVRVSLDQARTVLRRAVAALPERPLGIEVGARDALLSFGFVGVAMRSSATVGDALGVLDELHRASGSLADFIAEGLDGDEIELYLRERWPDPALLPFLAEEAFASTIAFLRSVLGETWTPTRLFLSYPSPVYAARYERFFRCPVHFAADADRLVISSDVLGSRIPTHHEPTLRTALAVCRSLIAPARIRPGVVAAVEAMLNAHLHRPLTMAEIAAQMHISERTLRRQLAEAGDQFGAIRDRVRERHATALLRHSTLAISAVAAEVGFSDGREFRRAYRRWTGRTPLAARTSDDGSQAGLSAV